MNTRFGLICAVAVVTLGGVAGNANAQIVTVSNWNYIAVNPNSTPANRPTINPAGTYSVAAPKGQQKWRVVLDYGTLVSGTFTAFAPANQPGLGMTANLTITNLNNNGTWSFGAAPGDILNVAANQLQPNTAARIRLQIQNPNNQMWIDQGTPVYCALN